MIDTVATETADKQRDLRAIDRTGEDIATEMVGAKPVCVRGRAQPERRMHRDGVAGKQRRKEGEQGDDAEDRPARNDGRIAPHKAPQRGAARRRGP